MRLNSVDIWLSGGQSNDLGRATDFSSIPPWFDQATKTVSNIKMWDRGNRIFDTIMFGAGSGYKSGGFDTNYDQYGFDLVTFHSLATHLGADVYVVKTAKGATSFELDNSIGSWNIYFANVTASGASFMSALMRRQIMAVKRYWLAQGKFPIFKGVVWHQGEGDGFPQTAWEAYQGRMTAFIDEVRSWTGNATLPFFIGTVNSSSVEYRAEVRTAMFNIETADSNVHIIDTNSYPLGVDNTHWLTYAQVEPVGTAYYNRIVTELGL